jgi:hypothetical protein
VHAKGANAGLMRGLTQEPGFFLEAGFFWVAASADWRPRSTRPTPAHRGYEALRRSLPAMVALTPGAPTLRAQLDPASRPESAPGTAGLELPIADLAMLLCGIDLATARRRKRYSRAS